MTLIKCGLVQLSLKQDSGAEPSAIRDAMLNAYEGYVEHAAAQGVHIICFPELFNQFLLLLWPRREMVWCRRENSGWPNCEACC